MVRQIEQRGTSLVVDFICLEMDKLSCKFGNINVVEIELIKKKAEITASSTCNTQEVIS
jgi:hypothetical protein